MNIIMNLYNHIWRNI